MVLRVTATLRGSRYVQVLIEGPSSRNWLELSPPEWEAFRSGLMPTARVDFVIKETEASA